MNNHQLIVFCQRCQKEHDRTNEPMFETSVICDRPSCGGFVVSPSGRANIQIRMLAGLYIIIGESTSAWVAAHSKDEAITFFGQNVEPTYRQITKLNEQQLQEAEFFCDPLGTGNPDDFKLASAKDLLVATPNLPQLVFTMTNEELIAKKNELFGEEDEEDES